MTEPAAWFSDAKLGIFIHWGIFSVPAFAPRGKTIDQIVRDRPDDGWAHLPYTEWYPNALRFPDSEVSAHHAATYGDRPYESFRADFDRAAAAANGVAIYKSRRTETPKGVASDGTPYRTTATPGALNIILMAPPKALGLEFPGLGAVTTVRRLDGGDVSISGSNPVRVTLASPFAGPGPHVLSFAAAA